MNYNRKTFRFLKLEKSINFARRKNEVENKMLDTRLKVMDNEEKIIRQKLYEIRREKYSRSFYKSPERANSSKFVDVKVCEADEGNDENNKLYNLISASGVKRTKSTLRRGASVVEERCPGQVVRVSVSSKLEDKVTRDEGIHPNSFPPISKAKKRRHSVAIVTDIIRQRAVDMLTNVQSYMQSISGRADKTQFSKDDLCFSYKLHEEKYSKDTLDGVVLQSILEEQSVDASCESLGDFMTQRNSINSVNEARSSCNEHEKKNYSGKKVSISDDHNSGLALRAPNTENEDTDHDNHPPGRRIRAASKNTMNTGSTFRIRPHSSRSYIDNNVEENSERSVHRKCGTPVPVRRRRTRTALTEPYSVDPNVPRLDSMGPKRRPRTTSTPCFHQDSVLTGDEEKLAEQFIIRQLEIQNAADKMKKLALQPFGDSKSTQKLRRHTIPFSTSSGLRRRSENAWNDLNNNEIQRPRLVRRQTDDPQLLRKFVRNQFRKENGQNTVKQVLSGVSGDMPDCRYLRCHQADGTSDQRTYDH